MVQQECLPTNPKRDKEVKSRNGKPWAENLEGSGLVVGRPVGNLGRTLIRSQNHINYITHKKISYSITIINALMEEKHVKVFITWQKFCFWLSKNLGAIIRPRLASSSSSSFYLLFFFLNKHETKLTIVWKDQSKI